MRRHPFAVAAGQVVVDRDDVDALALQGVEIGRQRGHQGLAFAGDHFGDLAAVQHDAAEDLHVEVPHPQHPPPRLAADRKGVGQQVVQGLAGLQPLAELIGLLPQFRVGHLLVLRLPGRDRLDPGHQPADIAGVGGAE